MKKKTTLITLALGTALAVSLSAQSYALGFESLDKITPSWNVGSTYALSTTNGVTEGVSSLEVSDGGGDAFWDFAIDFGSDAGAFVAALQASGGLISIDVTSNEAAGNTGNWGDLSVHFQGGGFSSAQVDYGSIWGTDHTTIDLDFSNVDLSTADGSWAQLNFAVNQSAGTTAYFDNLNVGSISVIPEPSALGILTGLFAGLGLMVRRRR